MSSFNSTEKLKELQITEHSVASSPYLSPQDDKSPAMQNLDSVKLESQASPPPHYHVFTRSRKLEMVCIVSLAAIFSPLSSNIYFPALGTISKVSWFDVARYVLDIYYGIATRRLYVLSDPDRYGVYDRSRSCPKFLGCYF